MEGPWTNGKHPRKSMADNPIKREMGRFQDSTVSIST